MSRDNARVSWTSVLRAPTFWLAFLGVVVAGSFSWLLTFVSFEFGVAALAVASIAGLIIGLVRMRQNRPLGLGLVAGVLLVDLAYAYLAVFWFIWFSTASLLLK